MRSRTYTSPDNNLNDFPKFCTDVSFTQYEAVPYTPVTLHLAPGRWIPIGQFFGLLGARRNFQKSPGNLDHGHEVFGNAQALPWQLAGGHLVYALREKRVYSPLSHQVYKREGDEQLSASSSLDNDGLSSSMTSPCAPAASAWTDTLAIPKPCGSFGSGRREAG